MKVLFLGHYLDGTGYAHASLDTILALDKVGVDVVCRPVKLNGFRGPVPQRIEELENKNTLGVTHVVQHTLPHLATYDGDYHNILFFVSETYGLGDTSWGRHASMMDEIWVTSTQTITAIEKYNSNVHKIAHPIDLDKLKIQTEPFTTPLLQDKFVFYFIGEAMRRKNLPALLIAFHTEFNRTEDVALLIKTNVPGMNSRQAAEHIQKYCNEIKTGLKLYKGLESYIQELVITEYIAEQQMLQLHKGCDCLVAPSYGEAWHIPAGEAMALGKTPIVNKTGGLGELITNDVGWPVTNSIEPCFAMLNTLDDLYTANDRWDSPSIYGLRKAMREAFSNGILRQKKSIAGIRRGHEFSYEKVGNHLKELLNDNN